MTDKEILQRAIERAVINGYLKTGVTIEFYKPLTKVCSNEAHWYYETDSYYQLIFSHNFAKAFWSDKMLSIGNCSVHHGAWVGKEWEYHLQQMVIEKEPLKYLEKFL